MINNIKSAHDDLPDNIKKQADIVMAQSSGYSNSIYEHYNNKWPDSAT